MTIRHGIIAGVVSALVLGFAGCAGTRAAAHPTVPIGPDPGDEDESMLGEIPAGTPQASDSSESAADDAEAGDSGGESEAAEESTEDEGESSETELDLGDEFEPDSER